MKALLKVIGFGALAALSLGALAQQEYPVKPIKLVVPFAPGGASDAIARPVAQAMSTILQQPVVVENKPGAAGNIALDYVAKSPADGYTILLGNISTNAINQTSYAQTLKVVPSKDLTAIGLVATVPSVLVAAASFQPKSALELLTYAKANPGKVNYWLPGIASGPHFDMLQLEKFAGISMTGVPFSGGAGPGMTALLGGQVDIGLVNLGGAMAQIRAGKLRPLAVSTSLRLPDLPDAPTAVEAGLDSLSSSWQALFVPTATPKLVVQKLHSSLNQALTRSEVKDTLNKAFAVIVTSSSPEEAQGWVVGETQRWAKIISDLGVRPDQ